MTSLWHQLASASWVATTGIPLLLTIAAILAGFWGVRRQVQNDRRLLTAQHRAEGVHALGAMIRREARRMRGSGPKADVNPLAAEWADILEQISWDIADVCESVLSDIPDVYRRMDFAQRANEQVRYARTFAFVRRKTERTLSGEHLNIAVKVFLEPYIKRLEQAGRVLVIWDGYGPLPDTAPWRVGEIPEYGVSATDGSMLYEDEEDESNYNAKVPLRDFPLTPESVAVWEAGLADRWRTIVAGIRAELEE